MSRKLTQIEFEDRVKNLPIKVLSKYRGRAYRVLVEDELGIQYYPFADKLLQGKIPSLVTAVNKEEAYKIKCNHTHGDCYDYSKTVYKRDSEKVSIVCKKHGEFTQQAGAHLRGQGCPMCGISKMKQSRAKNGFSRTAWVDYCKGKRPKLYILKCWNEKECFFKIGITTKKVNRRYWKTNMPYSFEIVFQKEGEAAFVFDAEKQLHRDFIHYKYFPELEFDGKTECFAIGKGVVA